MGFTSMMSGNNTTKCAWCGRSIQANFMASNFGTKQYCSRKCKQEAQGDSGGSGGGSGGGVASLFKNDALEARAEQREARGHAANQKLLDNVLDVEFDPSDIDGIVTGLTTLQSCIDLSGSSYEDSDDVRAEKKRCRKAARAKFEVGLAMLNAVAPGHPMYNYYLQKKEERIKRIKRNAKWITIGSAAFIVLIIILIIAAS